MVALAEGAGCHSRIGLEWICAEYPQQNAAEDERETEGNERKQELDVAGTAQASFKNELHDRVSLYAPFLRRGALRFTITC